MLRTRKNVRLKQFDYTAPYCYFITICTKNKECILGTIVSVAGEREPDSKIKLSEYGQTVLQNIEYINTLSNFAVDCFCIMPNHIHMAVQIIPSVWNKNNELSVDNFSNTEKFGERASVGGELYSTRKFYNLFRRNVHA